MRGLDPERMTKKAVQIHDALEAEGFSHVEIVAILGAGMAFSLTRLNWGERITSLAAHIESLADLGLGELVHVAPPPGRRQ